MTVEKSIVRWYTIFILHRIKEDPMGFVKYQVGDVVQMKKSHPCGSTNWEIKRTGVDFVIVCQGCGHQVMIPRPKFEKSVKKILSKVTSSDIE